MVRDRSERAIKLGAEIDTLRAKRARMETELGMLNKLIHLREQSMERLLAGESDPDEDLLSPESWASEVRDAIDEGRRPVPLTVTDRIRQHFTDNPDVPFKPSELQSVLHLLGSQAPTIRQALKRLTDDEFLLPTERGYILHPKRSS